LFIQLAYITQLSFTSKAEPASQGNVLVHKHKNQLKKSQSTTSKDTGSIISRTEQFTSKMS